MNGYVTSYTGIRHEVHAATQYDAQVAAVAYFQTRFPRRKIKGSDVWVMLAEKGGSPVVHSTASLG